MSYIPHEVLSDRFQKQIDGRRVRSAVFLTFRLEPDFFEQHVVPIVLDLPLSHVGAVRLVQIEDGLKTAVDNIAVYYDRGALVSGAESAKLDIRRVPIAHDSGFFHPKNVLLLVEAREPDSSGHRPQQLIMATMSANLTRAGWWENVEVCHFEEVGEGAQCSFRTDLLDLIKRVKLAARAESQHEALDAIGVFVRKLAPRFHKTTNGVFHPRLYTGGRSVIEFLKEELNENLQELNLEIISPYFDAGGAARLDELQTEFSPREIRVFLPRADDGSALCSREFHDAAIALDNVHFAKLPPEMLRRGKGEQAAKRTVHAKVYRFFHPSKRYEALFVGSVNLTRSAFSRGGNFETAVLVENDPKRVPDWWLEVDGSRPSRFMETELDSEDAASVRTALSIRFNWARSTAAAFWDAAGSSDSLRVSAQGAHLFDLETVPAREWHSLSKPDAAALERILASTSFLEVSQAGGPDAIILVQEEGMAQKPSLLLSLTAADILRYWALLTPEQRAAFIADHGDAMEAARHELGIDATPLLNPPTSMFDTFAGVYRAFQSVERSVVDALAAGRTREAEYRLLGKKYDSLPNLLKQVLEKEKDLVMSYVTVLCSRQLVSRVEREAPEFRANHLAEFRSLKAQITRAERIREQFAFGTPEERAAFLQWFDDRFLEHAAPLRKVE